MHIMLILIENPNKSNYYRCNNILFTGVTLINDTILPYLKKIKMEYLLIVYLILLKLEDILKIKD